MIIYLVVPAPPAPPWPTTAMVFEMFAALVDVVALLVYQRRGRGANE